MLTIKHISLSGAERLYEVASFRYEPGRDAPPNAITGSNPPQTIWYRLEPSDDESPLTGGTVFVMNRHGKTVARYDLGASPVPHLGTHEEPKSWRPEPAPTIGDPFGGRPMTTCGGIAGPLSQDKVYVG